MTILQVAGFICSILIGFSLGLIGGGGSMLTLPVFVYILGINPLLSTVYSLFVVGITSFVGSVAYMRKQQVHFRVILLFSLPSLGAIFITRRYLMAAIPDPIRITESVCLGKDETFMVLFALVMVAASLLMIRDRAIQNPGTDWLPMPKYFLITLTGIVVGLLTGLAGIGGGFLIVPALVVLVRLPMKRAVGTSLLIITINSLLGFLSNDVIEPINWPFLLGFTILAILGILLGSYASRFISSVYLRKFFGWAVLGLSIIILGKETLFPIGWQRPLPHGQPNEQAQPFRKMRSLPSAIKYIGTDSVPRGR